MRNLAVISAAIWLSLAWVMPVQANAPAVLQSVADTDGSVWFATMSGALRVAPDGSMKNYTKSDGLNDDIVTQIMIAPDGSKWFVHAGTIRIGNSTTQAANGLSHLKNDGKVEVMAYKRGLPSGFVLCVAFENNGTVWIGTSSGLVRRALDGTTKTYTDSDGLPDETIRCVLIGKAGHIWVGTNLGVVRIDAAGHISRIYPAK
jgi:ligand-binding sensor domain-containing protein